MEQKYILNHGCHRDTIASRDTAQPEYYDTFDEAKQAYIEHRKFYRSIGYKIWFAEITNPDGTKQMLEQNPYW
jgi:hypothetical protein